jgi:hypothetical protein
MNTFLYGVFVSHGGLGGPPSFLACYSISVVAIDGVIKNQLGTQQDATPKGKKIIVLK